MAELAALRQEMEQHGWLQIASRIERMARHTIPLVSGSHSEAPTSRLGGRPNLPVEAHWPKWQGKPLLFVAQVDLGQLPKGGLNLPEKGALLFFYEGGTKAWGFSPEHKGAAVVLYSSKPLTSSPLHDAPKEIGAGFRGVELLRDAETLDLPNDCDIGFQDVDRDEIYAYGEWRDERVGNERITYHKIGGCPDPIQDDPKLEAHLVAHGLYCGNPTGFDEGTARGLRAGAANWELLLQIDSDEKAGMCWGDAGRLYWLMDKADLESQAFHKAWLILQCY